MGISITQVPAGFVFHGVRVSTECERMNIPAKVDAYPLPRVEELFAALARGQYFSKLDTYVTSIFTSMYNWVNIPES